MTEHYFPQRGVLHEDLHTRRECIGTFLATNFISQNKLTILSGTNSEHQTINIKQNQIMQPLR